jgi:peptidoglycan/LPS O-acetylase OafA/YrhL
MSTTTRPALTKGFIVELDGLRGIAILMVMIHRFWPRTGVGLGADVAGAGWIGVDLFFVISGFLIAGILLDTKDEPGYFKNFYARRVLRIFPLYYLFVIGTLVAFSHNAEFRQHAGSPFWYLAYLGNIPESLLGHDPPYFLAPVWSLAIEEQFYLTFPWIVRLLSRRGLTIALVAMIIIAPIIRFITMEMWPDHERVQYLFTLCRIDTIAIGCLLAVVIRTINVDKWREPAKFVAVGLLPSIIVLAIASRLDRRSEFDRVFGYTIVAIGCAAIVSLVILSRDQHSTFPLRMKWLTYLGKLCFGLYLLHRPADTIVTALAHRAHFDHELWLLIPKVGVAIAFASISWRLIERPFLKLKSKFATARHPGVIVSLFFIASCSTSAPAGGVDAAVTAMPDAQVQVTDAATTDAALEPSGVVLYPEGARHSPITPSIATHLQSIASPNAHDNVLAKVGDSITVDPNFLACLDGGTVDLAGRSDLGATVTYFTGYSRVSYAAKGGTTAQDAMTGSPCPLDEELTAIEPRIAVVMFGTNEVRSDWAVDAFGEDLWNLVDATIARGVIPIISTIPANTGYPAADARIPTFNRVIRAIAQGRGVPLVDLHHELEALPNRGISSDGLHPTVSPSGGCVLSADGLQYGYNVRNLITLEALGRTHAALTGSASDSVADVRAGRGTEADPFTGTLPLVDLGNSHDGVYRVTVDSPTTIDAYVVDRAGTDVDVRIVVGGATIAASDALATATVPVGQSDIVVEAKSPASEGDYLLVVERH